MKRVPRVLRGANLSTPITFDLNIFMIKQLLRTAALAAVLSPSLFAQSFCWSENTVPTTVTAGQGVSCAAGAGGPHADNEFWRRYNPLARGMTSSFNVTDVLVGVEKAQATLGNQPATVSIFRDPTPGDPAPRANLVLLGSENFNIPNSALVIQTVTLTTPIAVNGIGADDLVVMISLPDATATTLDVYYPGANNLGQSSPTYLSSVGCGIAEPTDQALLGPFAGGDIIDVCGVQTTAGTTTYCTAKINSQGCSPAIGFSGAMSATAAAGFTLTATQELNNKVGLVLYSEFGRDATAFGPGGLLCVKAPTRRSKGFNSGGTPPPTADCTGVFSIDFNTFARGLLGTPPNPAAYLSLQGQVVTAQFWGRDPGIPAPDNFSLSNGIEFTVGP